MASAAIKKTYDAVVIGARCAGAATAMLLARQGKRVLAIDRGQYKNDSLSTHALVRTGVLQLTRWGLLPKVQAAGTPRIDSMRFSYGRNTSATDITPEPGVDGLYAPRRTVLDPLLVDAAFEAGAQIEYGVTLEMVMRGGGKVKGVMLSDKQGNMHHVETPLVIGADGANSTVARMVGAKTIRQARHSSAGVYAYFYGLEPRGYEWHFAPGVAAGIFPTNDELSCVFVATADQIFADRFQRNSRLAFLQLLHETSSKLANIVWSTTLQGPLRRWMGYKGFMRQSWGPGWVLVGDAGYCCDPITPRGISDAFRDAELVARATQGGSQRDLAYYQATRERLSLDVFQLTDEIASFSWDLDSIAKLQERLDRAMNAELDLINGWDKPIENGGRRVATPQ